LIINGTAELEVPEALTLKTDPVEPALLLDPLKLSTEPVVMEEDPRLMAVSVVSEFQFQI